MIKQIAILSDIHGNLLALQAVARDIRKRGIRIVFNLGDHLSGPLWPRETLDFLKETDWVHIRGNHDRQLVEGNPAEMGPSDAFAYQFLSPEDLSWLKDLPPLLEHPEGFTLFHGTPRRDDRYLLERIQEGRIQPAPEGEILSRLGSVSTPMVLCGHSHTPRAVHLSDGRMILNPGSVGLQAYQDEQPEPHRVETGSPPARYALLKRSEVSWEVEMIHLPYDHQRAAARAEGNGRPEWAQALVSGRIDPPLPKISQRNPLI